MGDVDEFQNEMKGSGPRILAQGHMDLPWHLEPAAQMQKTLVVPVFEV